VKCFSRFPSLCTLFYQGLCPFLSSLSRWHALRRLGPVGSVSHWARCTPNNMQKSNNVTACINVKKVIERLKSLKTRVARVYIVLKHTTYGLGPPSEWMDLLCEYCHGFYFSSMEEAMDASSASRKRPRVIAMLGSAKPDAQELRKLNICPILGWQHLALFYLYEDAIVNLDVGIGRDGVPIEILQNPDFSSKLSILEEATVNTEEVMWTARDKVDIERVQAILSQPRLATLAGRWKIRHGAATSLLDLNDDSVLLDGVRVGLALFRDLVTVTTHVFFVPPDVYPAEYKIGYRKTLVNHHFTLPIGYAHCNAIRPKQPLVVETRDGLVEASVVEVGMGTSVAACSTRVPVGAKVRLLHPESPTLRQVSQSWNCTPQQTLFMMASVASSMEL
jgi:alanine racemase